MKYKEMISEKDISLLIDDIETKIKEALEDVDPQMGFAIVMSIYAYLLSDFLKHMNDIDLQKFYIEEFMEVVQDLL